MSRTVQKATAKQCVKKEELIHHSEKDRGARVRRAGASEPRGLLQGDKRQAFYTCHPSPNSSAHRSVSFHLGPLDALQNTTTKYDSLQITASLSFHPLLMLWSLMSVCPGGHPSSENSNPHGVRVTPAIYSTGNLSSYHSCISLMSGPRPYCLPVFFPILVEVLNPQMVFHPLSTKPHWHVHLC